MNIDLLRLRNGLEDEVWIDENIIFDEEKIKSVGLLDLKDVYVKGSIVRNDELYTLNLFVSGVMVVPCSLTLLPTDYNFSFTISDDLLNLLSEIDENVKKIENTIDIFPIIWENILMEIPMHVVSEKAQFMKKEGDGWKFITEDEDGDNSHLAFKDLKNLWK